MSPIKNYIIEELNSFQTMREAGERYSRGSVKPGDKKYEGTVLHPVKKAQGGQEHAKRGDDFAKKKMACSTESWVYSPLGVPVEWESYQRTVKRREKGYGR